MKKIGYARVSTAGQDLETQLQMLLNEGVAKEDIFSEKFTGARVDRPQFNEVLKALQPGDTLVVTKLDRMARNTEEGIKVVRELFERDIKVHVITGIGLLENTLMGRFFLQTLLAVAELERGLIIERMAEGKALAKQREDFREGRPQKFELSHLTHAMRLLEDNSLKQVSKMTGISMATLSRHKAKQKQS